MQAFNNFLSTLDSFLGGAAWFVYVLLGVGVFFTIYLRFPQIRFFRRGWHTLFGRHEQEGSHGDTSHLQSLANALSSTVGTGNVAGVALAIHLGGPAALSWVMVTAFFGMALKYVEVSLAHKYREFAPNGTVVGGPMYYMQKGLNAKWLAVIFSIATIFSTLGTGALPQMNNMVVAMRGAFSVPVAATAIVTTIMVGIFILGGIKRISWINEFLVPLMGGFYILGALSVILYNYTNIPSALYHMVADMFTGSAAVGGFLGSTVAFALNRGVTRGLFANEAGQGSSPILHAAARTKDPVNEGVVALLEPFCDTVVICLCTGLAVLSSGAWHDKVENQLQSADLFVLQGVYSEHIPNQQAMLTEQIQTGKAIPLFSGALQVDNGKVESDVTIIHARSVAEDVLVYTKNHELYSGQLEVSQGKVKGMHSEYTLTGRSLVHSALLSTEAFKRGMFGDIGGFIIPITLFLLAFSTAISWSYYGDRATVYLFGIKWVRVYHFGYLALFLLAAFADTTTIWLFSGVTVAFMTLPNLISIFLLRKEIKVLTDDFTKKVKEEEKNV